MSKRGKVLLFGGLAVLVGGIMVLSAAKRRQPATPVRLEKVERRDLTSVVSASGKIEPRRKLDVLSEVQGRIVNLPVREGDMVQAGQVVVRIDPTQYQANVERMEANLAATLAGATQARANKEQAERAYNRARDIRAQNAQLMSQEQLEQAQTQHAVAVANLDAAERQVDQARAALREAQEQLAKTTIRSTMSGRVTRLAVEEGEVAVPGTFSRETGLLMTISDMSVMQVTVNVDETDVVRIHQGDSVDVTIDAYPDTTFAGRVTQISNSSVAGATQAPGQDQAVDFEVEVTLSNPPAGIRPDLSATARIITDRRRQVLSVPIISLAVRQPQDTLPPDTSAGARKGDAKGEAKTEGARPAGRDSARTGRSREIEGVFVVDTVTNEVQFRAVKVGIAGDEYFEVLSGLREGETIVAGPYQAVRDLRNRARVRQSEGGGPDQAKRQ